MKICPMTEADCEKTGLLMKECFSVPWSVEGLKEMFHTEGYCSFPVSYTHLTLPTT